MILVGYKLTAMVSVEIQCQTLVSHVIKKDDVHVNAFQKMFCCPLKICVHMHEELESVPDYDLIDTIGSSCQCRF